MVAAAVAAAGAALIAPTPSAQAAESPGATFTWGVSGYVTAATGTFSFSMADFVGSEGATVDTAAKTATFSGGTGRTDLATHQTEVDYRGSLQFGYTGRYLFHFTDPSIVIDAAGNGEIRADVDWSIAGATPVTGSKDDVTLTTFTSSGDAWDGYGLEATPAWTNAVPAGTSYATSSGTATPVDNASWSPELVDALPTSVSPFFYKSSSTASQDLKAPAAFTATVPGPSVTVGTGTVADDAVTLPVTGAGFSPAVNAGDQGVYVGLAPSGGLPDVSSPDAIAGFAGANWVMPSSIVAGTFTSSVTVPRSKLDPAKSYSLYTWQAHSHSTTLQDTETPVAIDWSRLAAVRAATPTISGTATVGHTLGATAGTWGPDGVALAYQWLADDHAISGATSTALDLTPALVGRRITVAVTGTLAGAPAPVVKTSAAVKVAAATLAVAKPSLKGKAKVGKRLTATVVAPADARATYQWFKGAKAIKGATTRTLKVTKAFRGKRLSVRTTISRPGYTTVTVASAKTAKVR
ncbi:HtaA domain-containing protein [Nocardioides sp. BP30]|uniref:HtaA domain-containing protein n=1 Tax=Nocardioides sp. BP30 TaxID=3036374 RepID=UPI002469B47C|nr:HtaA domain-containing protein [Nocardioides sp. BP30]WGL51692.1 HtaA domain-containing protein [Nocardioides sp. BP30]